MSAAIWRRFYSLFVALAVPAILLRLVWRSRRAPAYRQRLGERFGFYGQARLQAHVWIHAVSVGEVQAARPLIEHLLARSPDKPITVTTTTPTGAARLGDLYGERVRHVYTPIDLLPIWRRFLKRARPRLAVVMETEIWPCMLAACAERGVDVLLANARLSERSARGYARLASLTRATLRKYCLIAAQAEADADRFIRLGALADRVLVIGSLKFDLPPSEAILAEGEQLRNAWGPTRPVWVAASTHEGEDEPILAAHTRIRARLPDALLVLVPRHPERFDAVARLIANAGWTLARRSRGEPCHAGVDVLLGDTMGELPRLMAAGDLAFVGGSLVPVGGHNVLEAAALARPVIVGPHVFNFTEIIRLLEEAAALRRIADSDELAEVVVSWMLDQALRERMGHHAIAVVERNRGAAQRLIALVEDLSGPRPSPRPHLETPQPGDPRQ